MIADNKDFATWKEIKYYIMVIYDSDSSISSTTTTSYYLINKGDINK